MVGSINRHVKKEYKYSGKDRKASGKLEVSLPAPSKVNSSSSQQADNLLRQAVGIHVSYWLQAI